ncbi:MAG: glycosyltransferase family 9 protein, partial [Actinomycetota bacterium]|nr:glycosyltransferase family 9 protein [Actinomycetota bacterium]
LLGRQDIGCAGCRAKVCPFEGHPCLDGVPVEQVLDAVETLAPSRVPELAA